MNNNNNNKTNKIPNEFFVNDLGLAAYMHMIRFKISRISKSGNTYFKIDSEKDYHAAKQAETDYYDSDFARFDQAKLTLMRMRNSQK